jgi:two-component system chemotaxis sensor kinase CheA
MDTSEYLPMFVAESREHLQELNLAVVRIEEVPEDRATLDEIFRIAHSLKGMSATMGFGRMAALTHEMEDVFELLRQRRGALERTGVDVLLECLDALSVEVDSIDGDGVERLDPAPLIARLRALVREREADQERDFGAAAPAPDLLLSVAEGRRVLHAVVLLDDDVSMPAVRAYMLLAAAAEHGQVIASVPSEVEVDTFAGRSIELWVATEAGEDVVTKALREVADVHAAHVEATAPRESALAAADGNPATHGSKKMSSTVRVDAARLDQLMHLMGELLVSRTKVESLVAGGDVPGLPQAMQELTRDSQALQAMVMQVRMIPVEAVLMRFPRLVRDLSSKLGKRVELTLTGQETELDRTVVEKLGDPLVHLIRNALDHGLESPEERVAAGKPAEGSLEIAACHLGGSVVITVRDDGHGVDPSRVARKAAERGLIPLDAVAAVDMPQAIELLFAAGFSTVDHASDVSGRGVGMDAVCTAIRELGGEVLLQSETGVGTLATIRLPLTLAIISVLLVDAKGVPLAIPLERVERTLRLGDHVVRSVAGRRMLVLQDGVLPLIDLADSLGYGASAEPAFAVLVRGGDQRLALVVEELIGQREFVTRPLPGEVAETAALSGGAVLSNGEIALIVDCDVLAGSVGVRPPIATAA